MRPSAAWAGKLGALPPLLLVLVASVQIVLVERADLSPWLGGGFGMFSTLDDRGHRHLDIMAEWQGRMRGVIVPEELADRARRTLALPTRARLLRLARELAERSDLPPGYTLRLKVWRNGYDPETLQPSSSLLRAVVFRPGAAAGGS